MHEPGTDDMKCRLGVTLERLVHGQPHAILAEQPLLRVRAYGMLN